jgi:hypothetical protein
MSPYETENKNWIQTGIAEINPNAFIGNIRYSSSSVLFHPMKREQDASHVIPPWKDIYGEPLVPPTPPKPVKPDEPVDPVKPSDPT